MEGALWAGCVPEHDTADSATVASFAVFADGRQRVKRLQLRINVPDPTGAAGCSAFFPKVVFGDAQWLGP